MALITAVGFGPRFFASTPLAGDPQTSERTVLSRVFITIQSPLRRARDSQGLKILIVSWQIVMQVSARKVHQLGVYNFLSHFGINSATGKSTIGPWRAFCIEAIPAYRLLCRPGGSASGNTKTVWIWWERESRFIFSTIDYRPRPFALCDELYNTPIKKYTPTRELPPIAPRCVLQWTMCTMFMVYFKGQTLNSCFSRCQVRTLLIFCFRF